MEGYRDQQYRENRARKCAHECKHLRALVCSAKVAVSHRSGMIRTAGAGDTEIMSSDPDRTNRQQEIGTRRRGRDRSLYSTMPRFSGS